MSVKELMKESLKKNERSTDGKLRMSLQDVCDRWPNGFILDSIDYVGNQEKTYLVCFPREDNMVYFFAGGDLNRIMKELVVGLGLKNVDDINDLFKNETIKLKLNKIETSGGHYFFKTAIVD